MTSGKPTLKTSTQSRGLVRSLNRKGVPADKGPAVVRKTWAPSEPAICERCGAVFMHRTWRGNRRLSRELMAAVSWTVCPACEPVSRAEAQGKVVVRGAHTEQQWETIRRRINNVAARAAETQPERRIASMERGREGLEVITTSQKLAHRIVHELEKVLGGKASYHWNSDDGTLLALWQPEQLKRAK